MSPAPWDKLREEPEEDYEIFSRFLAHPEPYVRDFAQAWGLNEGTVGRLAARWRWRARRAALVAHLSQERIHAAEVEARDLGAEIGRHLGVAVDLAGEALRTALATGDLPSIKDSLSILAEAHKQVQLGSGKPTAIVNLSDADERKLQAAEEALAALGRTTEDSEDEQDLDHEETLQ